MKFNTVVEPESNSVERGFLVIIFILMFAPFGIGVITETYYLLLSLPIGVMFILIYNSASKGKFYYKNWIQDEKLDFNQSFLKFDGLPTEFDWNTIENLSIEINSYDGEVRSASDHGMTKFKGIENSIAFQFNKKDYFFNFYIQDADEKKNFIRFLRDKQSYFIKEGNVKIFLNRFDRYKLYKINSIEEGCEDLIR